MARHADYESPCIEVQGSQGVGQGRRVVAREAMPAAALVMAAKALHLEPQPAEQVISIGLQNTTGSADGSSATALPAVIRLLMKHPEVCPMRPA